MIIAFRSLLHMESDADRRAALRAVHRLLAPGGRLVFDVFAPAPDDITETHGRWIEREPGIFERADWDEDERRLVLSVRGRGAETSLSLAWVSVTEWRVLLGRGGLRRRGPLRLVRPQPVGRPRGLDLGLPARLATAEIRRAGISWLSPFRGKLIRDAAVRRTGALTSKSLQFLPTQVGSIDSTPAENGVTSS